MNSLLEVASKVREEDVVKLAQELVRIPSPNPPGKYGEIVGFLENRLKELGMHTEIVAADPNRPNLLGWLKKEQERKFLFVGHTDAVPVSDKEKSAWTVDPYRGDVVDGRLHGRGSTDMKGGIASVLVAIKALQDAGVQLENDLMVAWCVDEETTGPGGSRYVAEKGYFKPVIGTIDPEPSDMHIRGWFKGRSQYEITVAGKSVHSSTPEKGVNAISKMASIVLALDDLKLKSRPHDLLGPYTKTVVEIEGGSRVPSVPGSCKAILEVRMVPGQDFRSVKGEIEDMIKKLKAKDPDIDATVEAVVGRNPLEIPRDSKIIIETKQASKEVTGKEAGFFTQAMNGGGAGDCYSLLQQGIPSIYYGPGSHHVAHMPNEYVSVRSMLQCAKVYALVIPRMCGVTPPK